MRAQENDKSIKRKSAIISILLMPVIVSETAGNIKILKTKILMCSALSGKVEVTARNNHNLPGRGKFVDAVSNFFGTSHETSIFYTLFKYDFKQD